MLKSHRKFIKIIGILLLVIIVVRFNWWMEHALIYSHINKLNKGLVFKQPMLIEQSINPDTAFIYHDKKYYFSNTKNNIWDVMENPTFIIQEPGLMGEYCRIGLLYAEVPLVSYINGTNGSEVEMGVTARFSRTWFLGWQLKSMESNNSFFAYLFIDKSINPDFKFPTNNN